MTAPHDVESVITSLNRARIYDAPVTFGEISFERAGGRNANLIVRRAGAASYLVKRAHPWGWNDGLLEHEAAFCTLCQERDAIEEFRDVVPRIAAADSGGRVFVYELIEPAEVLWSIYDAKPNRVRVAVGVELGRFLAQFHDRCAVLIQGSAPSWLPRTAPAPFEFHRPSPRDLRDMSVGVHALISILQQRPVICRELDGMRADWIGTDVIHGDIRSDNVLVSLAEDPNRRLRVRIVDFETVQMGDRAWDLGGAFQDAVLFWLCSMSPGTDVREMWSSAKHSFGDVRALCKAILTGYLSSSQQGQNSSLPFIRRAERYSAVRMLQSAYEFAYEASGLPWQSVLLAQLAENLLAGRRAEDFYGLAGP